MSHRNRGLNDYIRLCKDIDSTHVMGQVIASALRGSRGVASSSAQHPSALCATIQFMNQARCWRLKHTTTHRHP